MNKEDIIEQLNKRKSFAETILNDEGKSEEFADDIENRFNKSLKNKNPLFLLGKIKELKTYIPLLISLIRSYAKKEYKQIPFATIVAIVAALAYFLAPIDLIPDFIPGFGLVDDASIIAFCFLAFKNDLDKYSKWRKQMDAIDVEIKKTTLDS
ncbi:MAG: DUF1232 domain-containing protein [Erysipelotrichaceae bacterium]|nr:DUF1232 domain-containing protein [Erysipelotrichaceae bacterium]